MLDLETSCLDPASGGNIARAPDPVKHVAAHRPPRPPPTWNSGLPLTAPISRGHSPHPRQFRLDADGPGARRQGRRGGSPGRRPAGEHGFRAPLGPRPRPAPARTDRIVRAEGVAVAGTIASVGPSRRHGRRLSLPPLDEPDGPERPDEPRHHGAGRTPDRRPDVPARDRPRPDSSSPDDGPSHRHAGRIMGGIMAEEARPHPSRRRPRSRSRSWSAPRVLTICRQSSPIERAISTPCR
jgi:hypothetical protein